MSEKTAKRRVRTVSLGLVLWHMDRLHDNRNWKHVPIKERAKVLSDLFVKYSNL